MAEQFTIKRAERSQVRLRTPEQQAHMADCPGCELCLGERWPTLDFSGDLDSRGRLLYPPSFAERFYK